ncbi:MAG: alkaline phosphatase family protein [Hydrococcus sp. SU_1_0]|nr:alkaline phosphatase family protein [Hydrococcus sp. SU_1_0]
MFVRRYFCFFLLAIMLLFWACSTNETRTVQKNNKLEPTVILISFDGFRWDYLEKVDTPNLDNLIANGVKAKALIPAFPTKTFPNHYTIVTGLYPENHGIIANTMYDPQFNSTFSLGDRSSVEDGRWWGGEPIWVTAKKQGQVSATLFWPGSEAPIKDIRPTYWEKYNGKLAYHKRVQKVLDWLELPTEKRPTFIALYFDEPDSQGHKYGSDSKEVRDAIGKVDTTLGWLLEALKQREILEKVNIIVTSDHGMTTISPERVIFLDDYIDLNTVEIIDWSPVLALRPRNGEKEKVYNALANAHPQLNVYYKKDIPERLHFRNHGRITPIIGIANEGWSITSHSLLNSLKTQLLGGSHGYDNQLSSMHGIFIASGPVFKKGLIVESFENIHIYDLIAKILDLNPASNDGNLDSVEILLKP